MDLQERIAIRSKRITNTPQESGRFPTNQAIPGLEAGYKWHTMDLGDPCLRLRRLQALNYLLKKRTMYGSLYQQTLSLFSVSWCLCLVIVDLVCLGSLCLFLTSGIMHGVGICPSWYEGLTMSVLLLTEGAFWVKVHLRHWLRLWLKEISLYQAQGWCLLYFHRRLECSG